MIQCCENEYEKDYHHYGGRGITVCADWHNFAKFAEWAKSNGYSEDLTLDRIDTNGSYTPENCRWVDRITQNNNTRGNLYITAFGSTMSLAQWLRDPRCKVGRDTVKKRLAKGMDAESALTL